jgi:hypothetical protein
MCRANTTDHLASIGFAPPLKRRPMRPTRRVIGPRINLNKHWDRLEEIYLGRERLRTVMLAERLARQRGQQDKEVATTNSISSSFTPSSPDSSPVSWRILSERTLILLPSEEEKLLQQ